MKLGLLQCDDVKESLQAKHGNYPAMFRRYFSELDPDIRLAVYDVRAGEFPAELDACDAYITTGSQHGLADGLAWVEELIEFIRTLHVSRKKFIGICFGHQLLAEALGGVVKCSERGWGVGLSENRLIGARAWMQPPLGRLRLLVSHQDQVSELPNGAELLSGSDFCPYFMYAIEQHMLAVQGHPEFTPEYARDLMYSRLDRIPREVVERAEHSLEKGKPDSHVFGQWVLNFVRGN